MDFIRNILVLCRKEFLSILKDPRSRVVLFMPVLIQSLIFGYAATFDLNNVPYALLDQSQSHTSRKLIDHINGTGIFHQAVRLDSLQQMKEVIDQQKALLVIHIPVDFEQKLHSGQMSPIQIILDARNTTTASAAAGYIASITDGLNQQIGEQSSAITIESRVWFNPNVQTRWQIMSAMTATLTMLQILILSALSVAREREQGTFDQLLVTPLNSTQIMFGKGIPPIIIGLVQASIILMVTLFWFKIPMAGSIINLYLGLGIFTIAIVGVGLTISSIAKNMQQAMFYAFVLIMPMILLSGLITPIRNMPEFLQYCTLINPLRFAVDFVHQVYLEGAAISQLGYDLLPLMIMGMITLPIARYYFKNKLI
ncbi:ABC transporter permease [Neisseria sp. Ec49-e6-T10]|uniref:ABC transporter permease n=1 Tax=Neisseria sp. Ec49-e6-T10 TaxID=3140744 RepID=UPI003EB6F500